MLGVRALASLGRSAREDVRIRVRQPLRRLHAVLPGRRRPRKEVLALLQEELNVKEVAFLDSAEALVSLVARPNFRVLGPRFQQKSNAAATALRNLSQEALERVRRGEPVTLDVEGETVSVESSWVEVVEEAAGDLVVRTENGHTAALDPTLDEELRTEGMARELVNRIQRLRKESGLEITDRILLAVDGPDPVAAAARSFGDFIAGETLAVEMGTGAAAVDALPSVMEDEVDGVKVRVALRRAG